MVLYVNLYVCKWQNNNKRLTKLFPLNFLIHKDEQIEAEIGLIEGRPIIKAHLFDLRASIPTQEIPYLAQWHCDHVIFTPLTLMKNKNNSSHFT